MKHVNFKTLGLSFKTSLCAVLLCPALLTPANAQDTCDAGGGPQALVQYKVAHKALEKCQFPEFEQSNPPRWKVYHDQISRETKSYTYDWAGTNGYFTQSEYNSECETDKSWSEGSFSGHRSETRDLTYYELTSGPYCDYTNYFSGSHTTHYDNSDGRTNLVHKGNCGGQNCDITIYSLSQVYNTSISPIYGSFPNHPDTFETLGWHFLKTWENAESAYKTQSGACGYMPLDTYNSTNSGYRYLEAVLNVSGDIISPTHKEADLSTTDEFTPEGTTNVIEYFISHHTTVDLENEYTDGELFGNIMSEMPAYPDDWYIPGYDFLQMCAFSIIHKTHTTGPFNGKGFYNEPGAQLQKMKYRFCVPQTDIEMNYQITWDVITYNLSTGAWSTEAGSTTVSGTGDQVNDVCSEEFYAAPPDWDQSPYDGFVFRWVDNVKVTAVSKDQSKSLVGSGPFKSMSHGGGDCGSCGGHSGSGGFNNTGGFQAAFSMGQGLNASAQSLEISSLKPTLNLATPAGLTYTAYDSSIQVIPINGLIRQVKAPQALANVVTLNAFAYKIRYYLPSQVGSLVGSVYQVTGSPFVVWKIENPDASTTVFNRLRITETRGADVKTYNYTYTATTDTWKLVYPGNLREDEWSQAFTYVPIPTQYPFYPPGGYFRIVTNTIRVPGGADQYKVRRVFQNVYQGQRPGFEVLIEETIDPENNPKTTTYSYYHGVAGGANKPLKLVVHPDGSWKFFGPSYSDAYDSLGRVIRVYSGKADEPVPTGYSAPNGNNVRVTEYSYDAVSESGDIGGSIYTPRQVKESFSAIFLSHRYTIFLAGERRDIQCPMANNSYDAPANLVTITKSYTTGANIHRTKSVERPDGTMTFYEYSTAGNGNETTTVYSGEPNSGKTEIVNGTKTVTVVGQFGQMISHTVKDFATDITLASDTYSNFDSFSRPTRVTHLDGSYEDTQFACCGMDSTTDRDGVVTYYKYDAMKRQVATTRNNITSTNVLDAVGRTLKSIRIGSDGSQIVSGQFKYNLAGEVTFETNALNGFTSFAESVDGSGHKVRTTTNPDGGTRIETYFKDGSLMSVTGTAEFPVFYEYGVHYDTSATPAVIRPCTKEIKGSPTGDEWTLTLTDMFGRSYKTIYSDDTPGTAADNPFSISYYNNKGQMTNQVDLDGVSTLYQYNAAGEMEYTAVDVDRDGVIDFDGTDRVSKTVSDVLVNYGTNVRRTRSYVWATDNQNTATLVSTSESSTDGLRSWNTIWKSGQAVTSRSQTAFASGGYRYSTNIAPDNSYSVSTTRYGTNVSSKRYDSANNQLSSVSYTYDPHGRTWITTDARNGNTTYYYNDADLVARVTTPLNQNTYTFYNTSLRAWRVMHPDSASTYSVYYPNGMLQKTYGARTYPVEYTYDYAGRMATMKTWQSFNESTGVGISGDATTTWNYNPYRGWLDSKDYADATTGAAGTVGTDYTYTPGGRLKTRTWARTGTSSQRISTTYKYGFDDAISGNDTGDLMEVSYANDPQNTPSVAYTYDRRGLQKTITQGSTTTTLAYTDVGQLQSESYAGGTLNGLSVVSGYDSVLRRNLLQAFNGATPLTATSYGYDTGGRLSTVTDNLSAGQPYSATYGYLANSPLVGTVTFKQNTSTRMTTTKEYDALNRLYDTKSAVNGLTPAQVRYGYNYNAANQRTRVTLANKSFWDYTYDYLGQVTSGKHRWVDSSLVGAQQFEYGFDEIGNRLSTKAGGNAFGAGLRSASYTPNRLNEYSQRTVPGAMDVLGAAAVNATVTVEGQTADRRAAYFWKETALNNATAPVWEQINVVSGANQDNRYAFLPQTPEAFTHDADGNLAQDGRWDYTWDAENRLVQVESRSDAPSLSRRKVAWEYDGKGRRIRQTTYDGSSGLWLLTSDLKFVFDGWQCVAELDASNLKLRTYVWGSDVSGTLTGAGGVGGLLMLTDQSTINNAPSTHFYSYDGNGNVAALIKATDGTASANYEYEPFGTVLRATGPMEKENRFQFSTKRRDETTDFLMYEHRVLRTDVGRWLSSDPIGEKGGCNLFGFVGNQTQSRVDGFGLAFYAVDGTWSDASMGANPWMLYMDTSERPHYYHRGPRLGGTGLDSWSIAMKVKNRICTDFCTAQQNGTDFEINLTGWSRGAIIAAGIARLLNDVGCDCRDCDGSSFSHRPVAVNWVGLFDAVAQMPFDVWWPRAVPSNVAHFDHAIRTSTDQPLFPIWHFSGATERAFDNYDLTPSSHSDIGMSYIRQRNASYDWIKNQARAAGVGFDF